MLSVNDSSMCSASVDENLGDLELFYLPTFGRSAILKRQADHVYSLELICRIEHRSPTTVENVQGKLISMRDPQLFALNSDVLRVIAHREYQVLEHWMTSLLYLGIRTAPRPIEDDDDMDRTRTMQSMSLSEGRTERKQRFPLCTQDQFRAVRCIQEEITGLIPQQDLAKLRYLASSPARRERPIVIEDYFSSITETKDLPGAAADLVNQREDSISFNEMEAGLRQVCPALFDYDLNLSLDVLIPIWRGALDELKVLFSDKEPIAGVLEDVASHGGLQSFDNLGSSVGIGERDIQHHILGLEDVVMFRNNKLWRFMWDAPLSKMIVEAWEFIERTTLDAQMPWTWNRDRLWMSISTLNMVAQLRGLLAHRQILSRLNAARQTPMEIVIT
jgi:hypothetical protein